MGAIRPLSFIKPTTAIVPLIAIFFVACSPTKYLKEGEYFLKEYSVEADNKKVMQYYPEDYVKQKPNKKIQFLNIYPYASIYNIVDPQKEEKREEKRRPVEERMNRKRLEKGKEPREKFYFSRWFRKIGEAPVVYSPVQAKKSAQQITTLLKNKGYYNAETTDSVKYKGKMASVYYNINAGKPYVIRNYRDSIEDPEVAKLLEGYFKKSQIKAGLNVDVSLFDTERENINQRMLENGYYRFAKEYIFFEVDTFVGNHQADVLISVKSPVETNIEGNQVVGRHKKYYIKEMNIYPDYEPAAIIQNKKQDVINYDTVSGEKNIKFLIAKRNKYTQAVLTRGLTIASDSIYRASKAKGSFTYYSSLSNFRLINFDFKEPANIILNGDSGRSYLNTHIKLTPQTQQSYTVELEGNTTSGKYGMASNLLYQHLNLFGGAEILDLKFKVELNNQDPGVVVSDSYFSETEYGVIAAIRFPNMVSPFKTRSFYLKYYPKTAFSIGYNFRYNASYRRSIFSSSYGYDWRSSSSMSHFFNALEFSSVKISRMDSTYLSELLKSGQFEEKYDHMILGSSYTMTYNTQNIKKSRDFHYLRIRIEPAGNILYLIEKSAKAPKLGYGEYLRDAVKANNSSASDEVVDFKVDSLNQARPDFYTLFNLPYSQYFKAEVDFRYYQILNSKNEIVYRINPGVIVPYGNSFYSPQEKRFYLGGASSMRAWQARQLGPGSFRQGKPIIYQYGDIKLEMNLEYRFKMFWVVEGALFIDAGNIWSLAEYEQLDVKKFQIDRFYKEIAIGSGVGLRLDFSFFVFRFDFGFKLYDPSISDGSRWLGMSAFNFKENKITFNFGIGYPF